MQFANPIWLAGLGGILIPLAIHLLSRKEGKVIRIGSIRHFEETSTRQFKSIKLNEILLLVLRSLLIILIVFFVAQLEWPGEAEGKTKWMLIEKGLDRNPQVSALIDSLAEKGFEKHAFANGFPLAGDSIKDGVSNYWSLIEALRKEQLDSAVVISANRSNAFRGARKSLPENVSWINIALPGTEQIISEVKYKSDSVLIRTGNFSEAGTAFTNKRVAASVNAIAADSIAVVVVYDKQFGYDSKILLASIEAINQYTPHFISIAAIERSAFRSEPSDWLIWLSAEDVPTERKNLIRIKLQPSANVLEQTSPQTWIITKRLTPESIIEENLTTQLTILFFPEDKRWQRATEFDIRASDESLIAGGTTSIGQAEGVVHSGQALWIILIALTLIAERIVSFNRMQ